MQNGGADLAVPLPKLGYLDFLFRRNGLPTTLVRGFWRDWRAEVCYQELATWYAVVSNNLYGNVGVEIRGDIGEECVTKTIKILTLVPVVKCCNTCCRPRSWVI